MLKVYYITLPVPDISKGIPSLEKYKAFRGYNFIKQFHLFIY